VRLLDRYVLTSFLQAYALCILAFISIWLVFDISDHVSDFLEGGMSIGLVVQYYLTQVPQILVILLPISLVLALLFVLGRMSRTNEVVSMLTAGISVPRLLAPLIAMGTLTAIVSGVLNFSLAPHAEQAQKRYFDASRKLGIAAQLFRNRSENRTWFIQIFKPEQNSFNNLQVLQQDEDDNILKNYFAAAAKYHAEEKAWELRGVKVVSYDNAGNIVGEERSDSLMVRDWSETPFRLASANMRPDFLSVPELRDYLHFNADFPDNLLAPFRTHLHHRLALPWTCLVVVFIAAPLAIGFSRGGVLTSVAAAIGLVFMNTFMAHFFLALGEGNRIPSWAAAWTPNVLFAIIGLLLLWVRSTNRDLTSLNPFLASRVTAS
jgi:LPS export ABC transporter permease LptG